MGPFGSFWYLYVLMHPFSSLLVLLGPDACLWILMDFNGSLWVLMCPYVFFLDSNPFL